MPLPIKKEGQFEPSSVLAKKKRSNSSNLGEQGKTRTHITNYRKQSHAVWVGWAPIFLDNNMTNMQIDHRKQCIHK